MFRILLPFILTVATFIGAGQTINACVNSTTGTVRILQAGQSCDAGEEPLQWGVVGIQGPPGPAGATGAAGATGPQGVGDIGCTTGQIAVWNDGGGVWECANLPTIAALQSEVNALMALLAGMTREDGGSTIRISGANLQIVSGSGATDGDTNGLGNLIIGYNEGRAESEDDERTGSHMLVLGTQQNYTGFGGIVAGKGNHASGQWASILGGESNLNAGETSVVVSGAEVELQADARGSVIVGGFENFMEADFGVILGGSNHRLRSSAAFSTIFGGNRVDSVLSTQAFGNYITCIADITDPLGSCP